MITKTIGCRLANAIVIISDLHGSNRPTTALITIHHMREKESMAIGVSHEELAELKTLIDKYLTQD